METLGMDGHACRACNGFVERELTAIYPASEVCLECMPEGDRRQLEHDLNQAQRLDRALLPALPEVPGWDLGLHYRPSRILSGDFYDIRQEEGGQLTLLVGDVMGKGFPAALLRTGLHSAIRALSPEIQSPARVLERANRQFVDSASPGRLASVFLGNLDVTKGELRYANAGHLPPLVHGSNGVWKTLDATGMVLGAVDEVRYKEVTIPIERGEIVAVYSDGITEAWDGSNDYFDERRLTAVIDELRDAPAQVVASGVADELEQFAPGDPSDDRTLLIVRRS